MTTTAEITENRVTIAAGASRVGLVCLVAVAVYVLSFGPVVKLTMTIKCAGYDRPARLPSLANAVNVFYLPLFRVLGGNGAPAPRNALNWYVHIWTDRPDPFAVDSKQFQEDLNRTLEGLRKTMKGRQ